MFHRGPAHVRLEARYGILGCSARKGRWWACDENGSTEPALWPDGVRMRPMKISPASFASSILVATSPGRKPGLENLAVVAGCCSDGKKGHESAR